MSDRRAAAAAEAAPPEGDDPLAGAEWRCCATVPNAASTPAELAALEVEWWPAAVPGTAAGALRAAARPGAGARGRDFDAGDWWYCAEFDAGPAPAPAVLEIGGLATVADVFLNGALLCHSENMFLPLEVSAPLCCGRNEIVLRFAALTPLLAERRARPRWKTYLVGSQNLRYYRTTLLGRLPGWAETPAPVGPWRPLRLVPESAPRICRRRVRTELAGDSGLVEVEAMLSGRLPAGLAKGGARLRLGDLTSPLTVTPAGERAVVSGSVRVPDAELWWPHTHGPQPLYRAQLELGDTVLDIGPVGFRTVEARRDGGRFELAVNGEPIFCRGANWMPIDPVSFSSQPDELRRTLGLAREAGLNMIRVPATTVYETEAFWQACDELGLLVWQDLMFAFMDTPEDEAFAKEAAAELEHVLGALSARPSLAVVCGNQEVEEQAAMQGLARERWSFPFFEQTVPDLVERLVPGVPYVTSNPTGGDMPNRMDSGVSQYFGLGGYLRPPEGVRRDGVRFASECLAFATPPERPTVEECFGGPVLAGHGPSWKAAVHHDAGRSWDLEDVRDHYVRQLFGVDTFELRYRDAERALDLGRAANAELVRLAFSEWRQPASPCAGALVLALRDLRAGAGWGVIDSVGRPKSTFYALSRACQPVTVLLSDEGLNGLRVHLFNDTCEPVRGVLHLDLFVRGEMPADSAGTDVVIPRRGAIAFEATALLEGFRDLTYAYRFTPPEYDVVAATLLRTDGGLIGQAVHLPLGLGRAREDDVGLAARAAAEGGAWSVTVSTRRFAEFVVVEVPGFRASDSWFHLLPGACRTVALKAEPGYRGRQPVGKVRALNSAAEARITVET